MHSTIQAIARQPLFMRTGAPFLFTAIDVEQISLRNGEDVTMMYIGKFYEYDDLSRLYEISAIHKTVFADSESVTGTF